jgi:hypothetical protein
VELNGTDFLVALLRLLSSEVLCHVVNSYPMCYTTWPHILEDCSLRIDRHENLRSRLHH